MSPSSHEAIRDALLTLATSEERLQEEHAASMQTRVAAVDAASAKRTRIEREAEERIAGKDEVVAAVAALVEEARVSAAPVETGADASPDTVLPMVQQVQSRWQAVAALNNADRDRADLSSSVRMRNIRFWVWVAAGAVAVVCPVLAIPFL